MELNDREMMEEILRLQRIIVENLPTLQVAIGDVRIAQNIADEQADIKTGAKKMTQKIREIAQARKKEREAYAN